MSKGKIAIGLLLLTLAVMAGWQIAASELANAELRDDLRDIAAQDGAKIGLNAPRSDDEIRSGVISAAREDNIQLEPSQVTVQHAGTDQAAAIFLAADYDARVKLPGFSFALHFSPSSAK